MCIVTCSTVADPDFAVSVFKDVTNPPAFVFLVLDQSVVHQMSQTTICADPQAPISRP
jgi:hypothetical protein